MMMRLTTHDLRLATYIKLSFETASYWQFHVECIIKCRLDDCQLVIMYALVKCLHFLFIRFNFALGLITRSLSSNKYIFNAQEIHISSTVRNQMQICGEYAIVWTEWELCLGLSKAFDFDWKCSEIIFGLFKYSNSWRVCVRSCERVIFNVSYFEKGQRRYTDLKDSDQFHEHTHWGVRVPFQLAFTENGYCFYSYAYTDYQNVTCTIRHMGFILIAENVWEKQHQIDCNSQLSGWTTKYKT